MGNRLFSAMLAAGIAAAAYSTIDQDVERAYASNRNEKEKVAIVANAPNSQNSKALEDITYEVTIKEGDVDIQKVFFGVLAPGKKEYHKIGFIEYESIIKNTPEYKSVKDKKVAPGTARYWICMSKASDRAIAEISRYATENRYDFVVEKSYAAKLDIKVNGKPGDIEKLCMTDQVIDMMRQKI